MFLYCNYFIAVPSYQDFAIFRVHQVEVIHLFLPFLGRLEIKSTSTVGTSKKNMSM